MASGNIYDNEENRLRYEAYSALQRSAVAFGETLPVPEIVVVGGQSDGKSSLLEAFLGFRFNVRDVEMGTRRPLIVQMVHDPAALQPVCRLQDEDSTDYGEPITPESAVADKIRSRTEAILKQTGGTVSDKPIVMRAEYAHTSNLTLVDTPGFILKARKGEADSTPDDVIRMVNEQIAPPNRLIVFLQQSSVEWCSSLWLHLVAEVDPQFQRTVVVASKFDNRLKEFTERWEVDRYLSATGYLHANVKPFFVALPKDRNVSASADWRAAIQDVDASVFEHLRTAVAGGFDEAQFGSRIGFSSLKGYLEEELALRYRDAAPGTLALLQERCAAVAADLAAAESRLASAQDVPHMRSSAMRHVLGVAQAAAQVLDGGCAADPEQCGLTTVEERAACRAAVQAACDSSAVDMQWPALPGGATPQPPHADLRLYGGGAFERAVAEFQEAAALLAMPPVPRGRAANLLLACRARGVSGGAAASKAAEGLARGAAREALAPLLAAVVGRLGFVLRQAFAIAAAQDGAEELRPYVAFHAALRAACHAFVADLESKGRQLLMHHLEAATCEYATIFQSPGSGGLLAGSATNYLDGGAENAPPTVAPTGRGHSSYREPLRESQLMVPETPSPEPAKGPTKAPKTASRLGQAAAIAAAAAAEGPHGAVCAAAERLFGSIRCTVAQQAAPVTLKAAFLQPLAGQLPVALATDLFGRTDADFMSLFVEQGTGEMLTAQRDDLAARHSTLLQCKDEFAALARSL